MDEPTIRRLCDGVSGAGVAAALAALVVGEWRGFFVCGVAVVIAQALRLEV